MATSNLKEYIDLKDVIRQLIAHKRHFYLVWLITAVASSLFILCVPRYYNSETKLAPEISGNMTGGTLSDIASSFGFDLGNLQSNDAISPLLYPDLMEDNGFVTSLFNIHVKSADGEIDTDYSTYLRKHQKQPWWGSVISSVKKLFKSKEEKGGASEFDPYYLSEADDNIASKIRDNITLSVDKKTGVITVSVKAQDKLICKSLADSMVVRLQDFITAYRTNKARVDERHYSELAEQARHDYDSSRIAFERFSEAHTNTVLSSYRTQEESYENDMQLKYNTYTTITAQLLQASAKVQERTPAFTILKGADVPIRPAGPKRILFVIGMLFLATIISMVRLLKNYLWKF